MANTLRGGIAVISGAMLGAATSALAQSEASVAYQFLRMTVSGESTNLPVGIAADYAHAVSRKVRLVGVVDWVRKADSGVDEANNGTFAVEPRAAKLVFGRV